MACFNEENRVKILDQETGEQKVMNVKRPQESSASQHFVAIITYGAGMHLFTTDGVLVHTVPDSADAYSVALHPHNTNILALGFADGTVHMWDMSTQAYVSEVKQHTDRITSIRFACDCRLFLSSWDKTGSVVTLDAQFQIVSSVKLERHARLVKDILPLPSMNQCVTCGLDNTIKVWDCETGACLRTLTEHTYSVMSLAMHPNGQHFASGSYDRTVIIWSSETFEVVRRITFPSGVLSLVFGESDTLYAGVYRHGVITCNALTGEVGPLIIPGTGNVFALTLGKTPFCTSQNTPRLTLVTPQYLHPSPGLHPHMHCGPCLHNTLCTWLWWCCGRCAIKDD